MKLLYPILNFAALLYILACCAWPNAAWPAEPKPSPMPTLPIDFDAFCAEHHAGRFEGTVTGPKLGVVIVCARADFRFWKSSVPQRLPHYEGAAPP
jgi:hypothetical protein